MLNLIIIAIVGFMVYWWGNEGLLGALLQLVATVLAGLVALALWDPLVQGFLIERMPESAWGVGLVAPFALALLAIRFAFDKFVPGNVDFHNLVNRIGGGLFGFFSGILSTGLLVIGLQMVGVGDLLGYRGYAIDGDGRLLPAARLPADVRSAAKISGLWLPVDRIADKFFGSLSNNSFIPITSAPTLGQAHPNLAAESASYAMAAFQGSRRSVRPGNIALVDKGSFQLAQHPTRLPGSIREKTGVQTVVVGTQITVQATEGSGAADSDGNFRISRPQVALLYAEKSGAAGPLRTTHPIGFIQAGEWRSLELPGEYAYAASSAADHYWVFHVPPESSPKALRFKLQRLDLDKTLSNDVAVVDFRGAGWNVIKVVWGDDWDPLLEKDETSLLVKRMGEVVDGQYQKYTTMPGSYIREHFFGKYPELLEMAKGYSDDKLERLRRGGHDPEKVYAAYKAAVECSDRPTVILAKTIKGYGLGEAGEGRNVTHQQKKLNEEELREFRTRFGIPISDEDVAKAPFYKPPADSPEMKYLRERRQSLGGPVPIRPTEHPKSEVPTLDEYREFTRDSKGREMSTTMGFVRLLSKLCKDERIGQFVVPIVPDESRTFGMEAMFRQVGIYAHMGQLYEPVDSEQLMYYKEAQDGQILEEGITEAGSMASFIAAGTAYSNHGVNMIPFFIYYSMFGFQRIGDFIWAAADSRAKGFMIGGTSGRTTLNGEGLQHQDGQSLLNAIAFPTVRAFDTAYAYETTVIVMDGLRRLYQEGETAIYYITAENDNYVMPAMPEGVEEGIIKGIYKVSTRDVDGATHRVQLFGSGAILRSALRAQEILAEQFNVASDVWSVTSYTQLRRDAHACRRWNMLHPTEPARKSFLETALDGVQGPFISASDNVRAVAEQLTPFLPGEYFVLGTDGMGRSDTREALRRHFEVDAESIAVATLYQLALQGQLETSVVARAIGELDIDTEKVDPYFA